MLQAALPLVAGMLLMTALSLPAFAQSICTKPMQPFCMEQSEEFESEARMRRCVSDIEAYIERIGEYATCLASQITDAEAQKSEAREALDTLNSASGN